MIRLFAIALVLLSGWCRSITDEEHSAELSASWPTERVEMLAGPSYEGLIESVDDSWVHLIQVRRPRGRPMYLVIRPIDRTSVAKVVRLPPPQRAQLRQRIEQFIHRARIEAGRMEAIRLGVVDREGNHYQHYRGQWFTLDSTADEPTTRRIIVRIEQIFTAYRQILTPRTDRQRPLRLVVLGSMEEYEAFLRRLGIGIPGEACFLRDDNLVVTGSQLARFSAQLAEVKQRHDRLRDDLEELETRMADRLAKLGRELKQQGLARSDFTKLLAKKKRKFQSEIDRKRNELDRSDRQNARMFDGVTRQMFTRLFHEAFHAYLENYVYPHQHYDVPLWLNEGLAMVCEGGRLESDTLRIDGANREALKRLKAELGSEEPLPLAQFLSAGRDAFADHDEAKRHYVYAWGLAHYLTFEHHLLCGAAMDRYVRPSPDNDSPIGRFEAFVGMPLSKFEDQWRRSILALH